MSAPTYDAYRDSGIDWLGEIPSHWTIAPLKRAIGFTTGWTPPTGRDEFYDGDQLWANIGDLNGRYLEDTAKKITKAAVASACIKESPVGSLLFSFKLSIGQVAFAQKDMFTNEAIATFLPSAEVDLSFAYYAFPLFLVANAAENIYGAKLLNQELIRNATLALPPPAEQAAIAAFLDRETGKIDALVEAQTRLIELLKEKRQAVISHAVTKGLDPAAPMKDSGVEWLGRVPAHWEVVAIKRLARLQSGDAITSSGIEEVGTFPVYGGNGFRGFTESYTHDGDFVLIGRQGALCGNINYAQGRFWASEHAIVAHPLQPFIISWFGELLRTMNLGQYSVAAAQPGLSADALSNLRCPHPPIEEQAAIVQALDQQLGNFGGLIAEAERAIALLQERRAALISAAVTGKIDVRGLAPEQAEAA